MKALEWTARYWELKSLQKDYFDKWVAAPPDQSVRWSLAYYGAVDQMRQHCQTPIEPDYPTASSRRRSLPR